MVPVLVVGNSEHPALIERTSVKSRNIDDIEGKELLQAAPTYAHHNLIQRCTFAEKPSGIGCATVLRYRQMIDKKTSRFAGVFIRQPATCIATVQRDYHTAPTQCLLAD